MNYILLKSLDESDLEFLSELEGRFHWLDVSQVAYYGSASDGVTYFTTRDILDRNARDSGWCDATTGERIIGSTERLVIEDCPAETATALKLRYLARLRTIDIVE